MEINSAVSDVPAEQHEGKALESFLRFWYQKEALPGITAVRELFDPRPTDIILASYPKSGTTWLQALAFATTNRNIHSPSDPNHPLLLTHPQNCVPFLESLARRASGPADLEALPSPRLFSSHMSYRLFPDSVKNSDCKFVYVCRDPKDTLVSSWHFYRGVMFSLDQDKALEKSQFEEMFEVFCNGNYPYGPIWDHWLACWNESLARPSKVLFLKYEDMKKDGVNVLKRLAEFLGCAFSKEEEETGVVEEIVRLCSFEKLSRLQVNKTGELALSKEAIALKSSFFRKGEVGDWKNHFTKEMAEKFDGFIEEKLRGSGLSFRSVSLLILSPLRLEAGAARCCYFISVCICVYYA